MIISYDFFENILSFYCKNRIYLNNLYFETDCTHLETDWNMRVLWGGGDVKLNFNPRNYSSGAVRVRGFFVDFARQFRLFTY